MTACPQLVIGNGVDPADGRFEIRGRKTWRAGPEVLDVRAAFYAFVPPSYQAEFQAIAIQVNEKPAKVRKAYEQNDAVADLVAQMRKSKALDWLMHNATYVDQSGAALDTDQVLGHDHDHDAADHDHDTASEDAE